LPMHKGKTLHTTAQPSVVLGSKQHSRVRNFHLLPLWVDGVHKCVDRLLEAIGGADVDLRPCGSFGSKPQYNSRCCKLTHFSILCNAELSHTFDCKDKLDLIDQVDLVEREEREKRLLISRAESFKCELVHRRQIQIIKQSSVDCPAEVLNGSEVPAPPMPSKEDWLTDHL
jgi:hypothetical protein